MHTCWWRIQGGGALPARYIPLANLYLERQADGIVWLITIMPYLEEGLLTLVNVTKEA